MIEGEEQLHIVKDGIQEIMRQNNFFETNEDNNEPKNIAKMLDNLDQRNESLENHLCFSTKAKDEFNKLNEE